MKMRQWIATIAVSDNWIEDGFDLTPDSLKDAIEHTLLSYAIEGEVKVGVQDAITMDELDFVLWMLGYMSGAKDEMDQKHKDYISNHGLAVLPKIAKLKEILCHNSPTKT